MDERGLLLWHAKELVGYDPVDSPSSPRRSAYEDGPVGDRCFARSVDRWSRFRKYVTNRCDMHGVRLLTDADWEWLAVCPHCYGVDGNHTAVPYCPADPAVIAEGLAACDECGRSDAHDHPEVHLTNLLLDVLELIDRGRAEVAADEDIDEGVLYAALLQLIHDTITDDMDRRHDTSRRTPLAPGEIAVGRDISPAPGGKP